MAKGGVNGWTPLSTKILFFSGLAGVAFEATTRDDPRAHLLLIYGVMMGLAKLGDIIQLLLKGVNVNVGRPENANTGSKNGGSAP